MKEPNTLQHIALHLSKYAGELAAIAEHLDHDDPVKRGKAIKLAHDFIGRGEAIKWCGEQGERKAASNPRGLLVNVIVRTNYTIISPDEAEIKINSDDDEWITMEQSEESIMFPKSMIDSVVAALENLK